MRRVLVGVLVLAAVFAGCSDSDDDGAAQEVEERTGIDSEGAGDLGGVADDIDTCAQAIRSGEVMTAEDIDLCRSALGAGFRACDDGSETVWVTVDGETWSLYEGEAADGPHPSMAEAPNLCP